LFVGLATINDEDARLFLGELTAFKVALAAEMTAIMDIYSM
jgi:hypothetical protein